MKIDIWSDTRCPFCYIGKHNFEAALAKFKNKNDIKVEWHSFQLDPNIVTQPEMDSFEYLAKIKGISIEQVEQMHQNLIIVGKEAGIDFNFKTSVVANSFKSQMLVQLAKQRGLANDLEEKLFEAQFLHGLNVDDDIDLQKIGNQVGISNVDTEKAIYDDNLKYAVNQDIQMAQNLGIKGVPFFIFNDKYAVSGAQPIALFEEVIQKSWEEFSSGDKGLKIVSNGDACDIEGNC